MSNAVRIVVEDMIGRINLHEALKTKEIVEEQKIAMKDDMIKVDKAELIDQYNRMNFNWIEVFRG